ncbi:MAG: TIGR04255 family protein [Planctomycetaceae bacterium]
MRLPEGVALADLERLQDAIREEFPGKKGRHAVDARIAVGTQMETSTRAQQVGYAFKSVDEKRILQAQLGGFTLSRLAPYDGWAPFRDDAQRLWNVYRDGVRPEEITRLAVRYINRIDIPLPFTELKDYLRTVPEVSPDLPQTLSGLFMQLSIPQEDISSTAILTEAQVDPARPGVASIILDTDLFRASELPQGDDSIWNVFEVLHDRKNEIFEACITDSTRSLFR